MNKLGVNLFLKVQEFPLKYIDSIFQIELQCVSLTSTPSHHSNETLIIYLYAKIINTMRPGVNEL